MFNTDLATIILTLPGILVALTVHEFSHAYCAYLLGDTTAKLRGRMTLNPLSHIDIFGFLMLILFKIGWAKPVPINPNNFKSRKAGYFLVSIAGPLSNVLLAIFLTIAMGLLTKVNSNLYLMNILYFAIFINLVLAVFNLLPIPPLDGSKILLATLPQSMEYRYYQLQNYFRILLFAFAYFGVINKILFPIVNFLLNILMKFLMFIV